MNALFMLGKPKPSASFLEDMFGKGYEEHKNDEDSLNCSSILPSEDDGNVLQKRRDLKMAKLKRMIVKLKEQQKRTREMKKRKNEKMDYVMEFTLLHNKIDALNEKMDALADFVLKIKGVEFNDSNLAAEDDFLDQYLK